MGDMVTVILLWNYRTSYLLSIIPKQIESIRRPVMSTVLNSTLLLHLFSQGNGLRRATDPTCMIQTWEQWVWWWGLWWNTALPITVSGERDCWKKCVGQEFSDKLLLGMKNFLSWNSSVALDQTHQGRSQFQQKADLTGVFKHSLKITLERLQNFHTLHLPNQSNEIKPQTQTE